MRQQPIDRVRLKRKFGVKQQAAQFFRLAQLGQRGHAVGVAEAQRFAQQGQRRAIRQQAAGRGRFAALGQTIADRSRQWIGGIQQGDDRPAAGFGGVIHRTTADRIGRIGSNAQIDQALDQQRGDVLGHDGQLHRIAAFAVHRDQVGLVRQQMFNHTGATGAGRFQPRRATKRIARFQIGAGGEQHTDDFHVAGQRRLVQRTAALAITGVGARLVLEQQLHAGRIIVFGGGSGEQHRRALGRFAARTAFEQEASQAPVADLAGHGQR